MFWKKHKDAVIFGAALAAFTGYVLLDTFVIPRSYEPVAQESGVSVAAETEENAGTDEAEGGAVSGEEEGLSMQEESGMKKGNASEGEEDASAQESSGRSGQRKGSGEGTRRRGRHHSDTSDIAGTDAIDRTDTNIKGKGATDGGAVNGTTSTGSANTGKAATDGGTSGKSNTGIGSGNTAADSELANAADTDALQKADSASKSLNLSGGTVVDSYSSDGKTITLYEYREQDTEIYVADVVLDAADSLQTAFANDTYGKNVTAKTSAIAAANNAVLAINGDFYGAREKGYVIRNGKLFRDTSAGDQEDLVIYADGSFEVINESNVTAQELLDRGAVQVLSFGPALLLDGKTAVSEGEEVGKAMASNPRTAIGVIDSLHYVFVVSDGRTQDSEGLSLSELATFMETLGVETAYNLDGGGSSTMYFNGAVVNHPTTSGRNIKERSVSDIIYIQ